MLLAHESKIEDFKRAISAGTLRNAYLFFGDEHIGKRSFALALANFLETGEFDIPTKQLIDVSVFSPDEKGIISIDTSRAIKRFLSERPFSSTRKTAIVDMAESLTTEAQGSLLKIVEEPPQHGMIILISANTERLITPLISRLSKVYFARASSDYLEKNLILHYNIPIVEANRIAKASFGKIGLAIASAMDNQEKSAVNDTLRDIIRENINVLRKNDVIKNSSKISSLLKKDTECAQFNVNPQLQEKAVNQILNRK